MRSWSQRIGLDLGAVVMTAHLIVGLCLGALRLALLIVADWAEG